MKLAILRHKARLNAELTRARIRRGFPTIEALLAAAKASDESLAVNIPRWVRVNTLKTTIKGVFSTPPFDTFTAVESLAEVLEAKSGDQKVYHIDDHIPNLLAFPLGLTPLLTGHHLYTTGAFILQDKASCFPAHILNPPVGSYVIDACAAPGNKTTHLAAIISSGCSSSGKGKIVAFERDPRRSEILSKLVNRAGAEGTVQIRKSSDFLKSDPLTDPHLGYTTHLLLDPSCSGSGITAREQTERDITKFKPLSVSEPKSELPPKKRKRTSTPAPEPEQEAEEMNTPHQEDAAALSARLSTLSIFQLALLLHALSYPNAKRITYSTCSIYPQENEHVVVAALLCSTAKDRGWKLDARLPMINNWPRRGIIEEVEKKTAQLSNERIDPEWVKDVAQGCVRCGEGDGTGGFFVACLIRDAVGSGSTDKSSHPLEISTPRMTEEGEQEEEEYEEWGGIKDTEDPGDSSNSTIPRTVPSKKGRRANRDPAKRMNLLKAKRNIKQKKKKRERAEDGV